MRASALLDNLRQRARRRVTWITVALYGTAFAGLNLYFLGWRHGGPLDLAGPFLVSLAYGLPSPMGWQWTGDDRIGADFLRGLAQSLLWSALVLLAMSAIFLLLRTGHHQPVWPWAFWNLMFHWPLLPMVGWFIANGERVEQSRREALAQAREAQWNLLRSQLSPHFLFNALTAFAELGRRDWPATEAGLLTLAGVYRSLLGLSERSEASLGEERAMLEGFLAIEALRLGERLKVSWDWDPDLDPLIVPPLLLLPLVENAVKHGLERTASGGQIRISGRRHGGRLELAVANTGAWADPSSRSTGTGLKNLNARLRLGYRGRADFTLSRAADWTWARLSLPAVGDA